MNGNAKMRPRRVSRRQALAAMAASAIFSQDAAAGFARQTRVTGTLLVRGDADLSSRDMAWRVVQDVAETGAEAGFERRALGFAVNSSIFTDLLLTDEATGSAYRLAPDEAAFVTDTTMQRRESLGAAPEAYLRIGLVPAEFVDDDGGDRMVYAGPAFAAPEGSITLTLERLDLHEGDRAFAGTGLGQALILVLQGEIEIEEGEAGPRTRLQTVVGSGTWYVAHATPWGTSITALRDATYVLVASMQ